MDFIRNKLVELVLPLILGPIVYFVMTGAKKASAFLDKQPAWIKQFVVVGISAAFVVASNLIPGFAAAAPCVATTSCDMNAITPELVKITFGALTAFLLHFNRKLPV